MASPRGSKLHHWQYRCVSGMSYPRDSVSPNFGVVVGVVVLAVCWLCRLLPHILGQAGTICVVFPHMSIKECISTPLMPPRDGCMLHLTHRWQNMTPRTIAASGTRPLGFRWAARCGTNVSCVSCLTLGDGLRQSAPSTQLNNGECVECLGGVERGLRA